MSELRKASQPATSLLIAAVLIILSLCGAVKSAPGMPDSARAASEMSSSDFEQNAGAPKDIEWFKDQMKISEKYLEQQEGIMGMSWAHFFTMVFLVLFAIAALVAFFQRQRRTREILEMIRKEMTDGNNS